MENNNWIKRWAGSYTFISCSYWGKQYKNTLRKVLGIGFNNTLFIHKQGTVSFFVKKGEFENFCKFLVNKIRENNNIVNELLTKLKENSDILTKIMDNLAGKIPTQKEYQEFLKYFEIHLAYHNFMKKTPDFFDEELINKYLEQFKEARIYSEPIYSKTEAFFRSIAKAIGEEENYDEELLTCLTQEELEEYLKTNRLPEGKELRARYKSSALLFQNNEFKLITGEDVDKLENEITSTQSNKVEGIPAYKGIITGTCRVILDPFDVKEFNHDDILITGMTRPEFIPLIEKCSAIVTDAGGVLCHAAVIAREMQIPCIVGTENATKMLKDGDEIEVDADNGTIRKIE